MQYTLQIGLMSLLTGFAAADTWTVDDDGPADFSTIQAAIDHAASGDDILVLPGTYRSSSEELRPVADFKGKSLTLISRDGADVTYIEGDDWVTPIVIANTIDPLMPNKVDGFTIRDGSTSGITVYGDCVLKVGFSVIEGCREPGIWSQGRVDLTVSNCTIRNNDSTYLSGGILHSDGNLLLIDSTFSGNYSDTLGGALRLWGDTSEPSSSTILRCTFQNNTASQGAAISGNDMYLVIEDCHFIANTGGQGTALFMHGGLAAISGSSFCMHSTDDIVAEWQDLGGNTFEATCDDACSADFDGNGSIDGGDLTVLLGTWGKCTGCIADLNEDNLIDGADLTILLGMWGPC